MMISNIFGLHLGCMAHCNDGIADNIGKIMFVKDGWVRIKYTEFNDGRWFEVKDCKLLLKPLSAMSDEDKREFLDKFYPEKDIFWRYMRVTGFNKEGIEVYSTRQGDSPYGHTRKYSIQEGIWLCSKGYDVGLVPDENKEVSE